MQAILAVTIPFFALVLAGWLGARSRVLPAEAIPGLNAFVLYFALPCMLFRFGASQPLAQLLNPTLIVVYLLCALLIVFFTVAVTLGRHVGLKDAAFGALVGAFPNSGFMGVPLIVAMLGPVAAGPVISSLLVDLVITSSLCIAIAQARMDPAAEGAREPVRSGVRPLEGWPAVRRAAARALKGALVNPLPWAIGIGAAFGLAGWTLPGPLAQIVRMLGDAASPVALFTIGAVLWKSGQPAYVAYEDKQWRTTGGTLQPPGPRRKPQRTAAGPTPLSRYLPVALIKLFLHPLLVLLFCASAHQLGAPITTAQVAALVLCAALPSAANVSLLAERYGADNGRIARIIMASTALSFVTLTLLAWLFGARPQV